jgi:glycosyltransferase involved in cell wall biosynthesis
LIVSIHFKPENFRINEIVDSLVGRNHSVIVLTGKPNYPSGVIYPGYSKYKIDICFSKNLEIIYLPIILRDSNSSIKLALNYLSFCLIIFLYLPYLLMKKKIKTIFCYGTSPFIQAFPVVMWAKIFKIKSLVNVQDLWPESIAAVGIKLPNIYIKILKLLVGYIYRNSDLLLVQSKKFIEHIEKYKYRKVIYWPNSFLPIENSSLIKDPLPINNNRTFLYAGNIGKAQNLDNILSAFSSINTANLIILGDGSQKDYLLNKYAMCKNIKFLDRVSPADAQLYMKLADILVLSLESSYIFNLTIPNKLQAYLYSGKPILGICSGVSAEIICESKSGLVSNFDINEIKKNIIKFIDRNDKELSLMGKSGFAYYHSEFNHELLIDQLEKLII